MTKNPTIPFELSAHQLIKQQIKAQGPMDFFTFMDLALYHPTYGYYNRKKPVRGRTGDYFTSPQVSDLFSHVLADTFIQMKESLGTEQFSIIEYGAGTGELLAGILNRLYALNKLKGFRVWAVEKSVPGREALWKTLSRFPKCEVVPSLDEIDWMGGVEGCIFSNEFFDALPFHRLIYSNGDWRDVMVNLDGETLVEKYVPLRNPSWIDAFSISRENVAENQQIEIRPQIRPLYEQWQSFLHRGYVLTFDYGHPRAHLRSEHRLDGTWRCFYRHTMNSTPLQHIGDQDITADIDFTQLALEGRASGFDPTLFCSQGIFIAHRGESEIQARLTAASEENRRKIAAQVQQLVHPDAMGESFWVLLQSKTADLPPTFEAIPNRLRRLNLP